MSNSINLAGYHLSFDAEMTDASDMSFFINTFNNGDTTIRSNNEAETYVSASSNAGQSTYNFSNGALNITANPLGSSGNYTSGLISTGNSFYQNQGYFEIRAKVPSGAGFWPAFWMLAGGPTDYNTEVDLLEQPNNDGIENYFNSVKTPSYNVGTFFNTGIDVSAGYHTYGFMWTSSTIQLVFDGNYIGSAVATPAAMATLKMYLIANLAVGGTGSWPGIPANGTSATYSIDYIRAYSNDPTVPNWYKVGEVSPPDGANPNPTTTATTPVTSTSTVPTVTTPATITTPTAFTQSSGTDTLTVGVSEDALVGDAQYRVLVDGYIVGDVFTTNGSHSMGQISTQTVTGSWGSGPHAVGIAFLNAASDASGAHRALYVDSVVYDGVTESITPITLTANGVTSFAIPSIQQAALSPSTIVLHAAEDSSATAAQLALFIDGYQVTGPKAVIADNALGASQSISFDVGRLAPGVHSAAVADLNAVGSQNLYLKGAELNGSPLTAPTWTSTLNQSNPTHYMTFTSS